MNEESLTTQGLQRRGQILLLAQAAARRRRHWRFAARGIGAVAVLAIAAVILIRPHPPKASLTPRPAIVQSFPPPAILPSNAIEYIQTDPTIADRLTLPPQFPRWKSIDDTELLAELSAAGHPAGLACINGKTILLPHDATRGFKD